MPDDPPRNGWNPPDHDSAIWAGWRHHPPAPQEPAWVPCWWCGGQRRYLEHGRLTPCPHCLGIGEIPDTN